PLAISGLAVVSQPLAGEYAGTREALEAIPFAGAYGVDIGILIDLYEAHGLDALAQVDLGVRTHRNSPDSALSVMALHQHLAVHSRLLRHRRVAGAAPLGDSLTLHRRDPQTRELVSETVAVTPVERPPMREARAATCAAGPRRHTGGAEPARIGTGGTSGGNGLAPSPAQAHPDAPRSR